MLAEILSTGEELRTGSLVDTNAAYIAEKLYFLGINLNRIQCVGDNIEILTQTLQEISKRADIAIVTGGLGPTSDDLTAEAASKASEKELIFNEKAFDLIKKFFENMGRTMSDSNRKQAFFPLTSEIIKNDIGTAPGFCLKINKCMFFFLPGVPVEMKKMLNDYVIPKIQNGKNLNIPLLKTLIIFGLPESKAGTLTKDIPDLYPGINIGTRAKLPEIQIKLYTNYNNNINKELLTNAFEFAKKQLKKWIISENGESIELVVGNLLKQRYQTLSIAESCTGGHISDLITSVPGSSDYFLFSAVTYSNQAKEKILNVSSDTLMKHGAVSIETVKEMAKGARDITNSTYAIATSGIAGPGGGTDDKPVGTLCIGFADKEKIEGFKYFLPFGNREQKKKIFAMAALDLLRRKISGLPELTIGK